MGLCESAELRQQRKEHYRIEKILADCNTRAANTQKLLLLGAAECGKSTILKQMRIIHDSGFSTEEVYWLRRVIRENIIEAMRMMLVESNILGIIPTDYRTQINGRIVRDQQRLVEDIGEWMFSAELYAALKQLWSDQSIQEVYSRRAEFHLLDSTKYFFDDLDRIAAQKYMPNNQDVLRVRSPTIGVTETKFTANHFNFRVYDVGGQRSERRKWIHCFDNVNAIIFLSAVSEFDQKLVENDETNRLIESLNIFKQIVNNALFSVNCSMILFLNKTDLFAEKILKASITTAFPQYTGAKTYEAQLKFIRRQFQAQSENPCKDLYIHRTCATDTTQVGAVIEAVLDTITSKNMRETGVQ